MMIGVADIDGFVEEACHIHPRKEGQASMIDGAGSAGTVTANFFLNFIRLKVCPILGDLSKEQFRSIVFIDNATVNIHPGVKEAIEAKDAYLIYGAPYSPDKNPIEKMFSVYKAYLKRFKGDDWVRRHGHSLEGATAKKARIFIENAVSQVCGRSVQMLLTTI